MKIFDAFLYNGDPIVKLRLKLLHPYVDRFIITESRFTCSGQEKPFFWFDKNRDTFAPYMDKIHFIRIDTVPDMPQNWMERSYGTWMKRAEDWWRENYQRDIVATFLDSIQEPFLLVCTDADEIINPMLLHYPQTLYDHAKDHPVFLEMMFFYYNFQWIKKTPWYHGFVVTENTYRKDTLSNIRCYYPKTYVAKNAGWHCSYFFSLQGLVRKIQSFPHQEFNEERFTNEQHILHCLASGTDLFTRGCSEDLVLHDGSNLPEGAEEIDAEIRLGQASTQET